MGRKSIKEDKNIYQLCRESKDLSREEAAKLLFSSRDRILRIENGDCIPRPKEVLDMANVYEKPTLCNYFCSHECEIGQKTVPEIELKDLSQITLEVLASLNALNQQKDRLIEITVDGIISEDEYADFKKIQDQLTNISTVVNSLQLWVNQSISQADNK